jgi:hypothetical protein
MIKKAYTDDKRDGSGLFFIPEEVQRSVILEYFSRKYYLTVGLLMFIIGTLFGTLIG